MSKGGVCLYNPLLVKKLITSGRECPSLSVRPTLSGAGPFLPVHLERSPLLSANFRPVCDRQVRDNGFLL